MKTVGKFSLIIIFMQQFMVHLETLEFLSKLTWAWCFSLGQFLNNFSREIGLL